MPPFSVEPDVVPLTVTVEPTSSTSSPTRRPRDSSASSLPGPGRQVAVGQLRPPQPVGLDPEHVHVDDAVEVDRGVGLQEARDLLHAGDRGDLATGATGRSAGSR